MQKNENPVKIAVLICDAQPLIIYYMNYLGHALFSFNNAGVLVGNIIADFVKGRDQYNYPPGIQQGIMLHRAIDAFTDAHPVMTDAKALFRPHYGLYAGVFTDVVWDYFLANDATLFSQESLKVFTGTVYQTLAQHQQWFPLRFAAMFPFMQQQDWLYNYRNPQGIRSSFGGLVRRARYMTDYETAYQIFLDHLPVLQVLYNRFAPDVKFFAKARYGEIIG